MTTDRIDRLRIVYRRWIAIVLVVGAIASLAALPLLPPRAQPIRLRGDADLRHLVFSERSSVDVRFGFYEDLRVALDGGTLIVHPDSIVFAYIALALADVEVIERDYDPVIDTTGLPEPAFAGRHDGTGDEIGYEVLPGRADIWWLATLEGRVVVIPDSLIPIPEGDGA